MTTRALGVRDDRTRRLRCDRLSKRFGGVWALREVTIDFPAQGTVAVIGPNGAGKSTLLNVLTGYLRSDSGDAFVNGREIRGSEPYEIARMGVGRTFQNLRLVQAISVLDNCLLAADGAGWFSALWPREQRSRGQLDRVREMLEKVHLSDKSGDIVGTLSYGQQKLLSLACCLLTTPSIMLLDEPVAGVHPEVADQILGILGEYSDTGRVVVFIEHDLAAVRNLADTVIVMDEGRVIAQGLPSTVLGRADIMEAYLD